MEQLKTEVDEFYCSTGAGNTGRGERWCDHRAERRHGGCSDIVYLVKGDVSINEDGTIDTDATSPMLTG